LQRALAKIHASLNRTKHETPGFSVASTLFIVAPFIEVNGGMFADYLDGELVEAARREETSPIIELLSTHPHVNKRIKFIDRLLTYGAWQEV
jgi:Zn-dependent protease with chaperone function